MGLIHGPPGVHLKPWREWDVVSKQSRGASLKEAEEDLEHREAESRVLRDSGLQPVKVWDYAEWGVSWWGRYPEPRNGC